MRTLGDGTALFVDVLEWPVCRAEELRVSN